jgi:hypothetical protein
MSITIDSMIDSRHRRAACQPPNRRSQAAARLTPHWNAAPGSRLIPRWKRLTRAHFGRGTTLPWNRFLVRIDVPDEIWAAREVLGRPLPVGWDAIPEGLVSRNLGSSWLKSGRTTLLTMPSVIIDEEDNVMVNPAHTDCARIRAIKVRRFLYDHRV